MENAVAEPYGWFFGRPSALYSNLPVEVGVPARGMGAKEQARRVAKGSMPTPQVRNPDAAREVPPMAFDAPAQPMRGVVSPTYNPGQDVPPPRVVPPPVPAAVASAPAPPPAPTPVPTSAPAPAPTP